MQVLQGSVSGFHMDVLEILGPDLPKGKSPIERQ